MTSPITYFGIRHHGPGCANSLRKALCALQPDCIIIEGPTGAEDLLLHVKAVDMQPPVAMLSYCVDDPGLSTFHPYAKFSPEWQAIVFGGEQNTPVRFMDLPPSIALALEKQKREEHEKHETERASGLEEIPISEDEDTLNHINDGKTPTPCQSAPNASNDPLDWLAQAAGYNDGESWWNHMVEERGDGTDLFEAITHAMTELRTTAPKRDAAYETREAMREAHMRLEIKQAQKDGFKRIAIVCGAWHVPALQANTPQSADKETLKGLAKLKIQTTWVPWTYEHLSTHSGYAAGITAPGWYEYLWNSTQNLATYGAHRSVGWYVRIAQLLRKHELDCSSAHLIEAARLADALAAMRERPAPSLIELNEAALSVICNGNNAPMKLIERELMVGNTIGSVPADVPTVPLQKDLHAHQKSLRFKPEALEKDIDLDLRKDNDLARSHLLHRLNLLNIDWGVITNVGQKSKGTFHEYWRVSWQPRYEVDIIIASRYGHSIEAAATALCTEKAKSSTKLAELTKLIDKVLLANLPTAVKIVARELQERSVGSSDPVDLLNALPALANVYRYGNVRQTDVEQVAHLFDNMLQRAVIALPLAVANINTEAAEQVRSTILAADRAISLRAGAGAALTTQTEQTEQNHQISTWRLALKHITTAESTAPILRGIACRLLLDCKLYSLDEAAQLLNLNLSSGANAEDAAQWLDGFLNRNATVLLHNDSLWALIDEWLSTLNDEHFIAVLPLVRRTFSAFEASDKRDLGQKVKQVIQPVRRKGHAIGSSTDLTSDSSATRNPWHEEHEYRIQKALQTMAELLGVNLPPDTTTNTTHKPAK